MSLDEVLAKGDAYNLYFYARNCFAEEVKLLTEAILKCNYNDVDYNWDYLYNQIYYPLIAGSEDLETKYFDIPNFVALDYLLYMFARDVEGVNVSLIEKKIFGELNEEYWCDEMLYLFARDVKNANIELLQSKMWYADPKYVYLFARDVKGADVEFLQDYLFPSENEKTYDGEYYLNTEYVYKFAKYVDGANIDKLLASVKSYTNDYYSWRGKAPYNIDDIDNLMMNLKEIKNKTVIKRKTMHC